VSFHMLLAFRICFRRDRHWSDQLARISARIAGAPDGWQIRRFRCARPAGLTDALDVSSPRLVSNSRRLRKDCSRPAFVSPKHTETVGLCGQEESWHWEKRRFVVGSRHLSVCLAPGAGPGVRTRPRFHAQTRKATRNSLITAIDRRWRAPPAAVKSIGAAFAAADHRTAHARICPSTRKTGARRQGIEWIRSAIAFPRLSALADRAFPADSCSGRTGPLINEWSTTSAAFTRWRNTRRGRGLSVVERRFDRLLDRDSLSSIPPS